jgi:hypothetical protein
MRIAVLMVYIYLVILLKIFLEHLSNAMYFREYRVFSLSLSSLCLESRGQTVLERNGGG